MPSTQYMTAPIRLTLSTGDDVVRQVVEEGETIDVHLVNQIHTVNASVQPYRLVIANAQVVRYLDEIQPGTDRVVDLATNEQFEDYQIGLSLTHIPD